MTNYLETDQYTHVGDGCPVSTDFHPVDLASEIAIGGNGSTLRLVFHDPNTMRRIANALNHGADRLDAHLSTPDPQPPKLIPALAG